MEALRPSGVRNSQSLGRYVLRRCLTGESRVRDGLNLPGGDLYAGRRTNRVGPTGANCPFLGTSVIRLLFGFRAFRRRHEISETGTIFLVLRLTHFCSAGPKRLDGKSQRDDRITQLSAPQLSNTASFYLGCCDLDEPDT